jgi:hypothetical protein
MLVVLSEKGLVVVAVSEVRWLPSARSERRAPGGTQQGCSGQRSYSKGGLVTGASCICVNGLLQSTWRAVSAFLRHRWCSCVRVV